MAPAPMAFTIRYNTETGPQDVYIDMPDGSKLFVASDLTPEGVEWITGEMALLDTADPDQLTMVARDLRHKMPNRFYWHVQQAAYERLMSQPRRGALGRFKTQGLA